MSATGLGWSLPVELVSRAFDFLEVKEIVTARRVCRFFRKIVHRHAKFNRDIGYIDFEPWTMKIFDTRVQENMKHRDHVALEITLTVDITPEQLRELLDTLKENVVRLTSLKVTCPDYDTMGLFCESLSAGPAPKLCLLLLAVLAFRHEPPTGRQVLSAELFHGHAPELQEVTLHQMPTPTWAEVDIPWVLPAFSCARKVTFEYPHFDYPLHELMADVAAAFPNAEKVRLECFTSARDESPHLTDGQIAMVRRFSKHLTHFSLDCGDEIPDIQALADLGFLGAKHLEISPICGDTVIPVLDTRGFPDKVCVTDWGRITMHTFTGEQTFVSEGDTIVFEDDENFPLDTLLLFSGDLMQAVTYLDLDVLFWSELLGALKSEEHKGDFLPHLRILQIAIRGDEDKIDVPEEEVGLPNLEVLRVVCRYAKPEISAQQLHDASALLAKVNTKQIATVETCVGVGLGWETHDGVSFDIYCAK